MNFNFMHGFSMNPWDNLDHGISDNSKLYELGTGIFQLIFTIGIVGAVLSILFGGITLIIFNKKRNEAKERILFICFVIFLLCIIPVGLQMFASLIPKFFK